MDGGDGGEGGGQELGGGNGKKGVGMAGSGPNQILGQQVGVKNCGVENSVGNRGNAANGEAGGFFD